MLKMFEPYRDLTFASMVFRLVLASVCSGFIGLERASKNRSAGLRTHILVCMAASIASMSGHFLYLNLHLPTDLSRIGAQVVSGLGFLGAGTIIVTNRKTIRGLTTAASLWVVGIIGLVIGAGFYEGGVVAAVIVLLVQIIFSSTGYNVQYMPEVTLSITYNHKAALDSIIQYCLKRGLAITDIKVSGEAHSDPHYKALVSMRSYLKIDIKEAIEYIRLSPDCITVSQVDTEEGL